LRPPSTGFSTLGLSLYGEERFELLKKDLPGMDSRVEKQIKDIVKNLSTLRDSIDSKTRVVNLRQDVMEAMVRSIPLYRQKQVEVFERMRKDTNVPKETLGKRSNNIWLARRQACRSGHGTGEILSRSSGRQRV